VGSILILAALGPGVDSVCNTNGYQESSRRGKAHETNNRLSRQCGSLDVSEHYGSPWPVAGIALLYFT
jgi:hypothetical protein